MDDIEDIIAHYGVKGMKWGKRKGDRPRTVTVTAAPGKRAKASGGYNRVASADAKAAAKLKQKAKASTTDALSNKELKALTERMNLEQRFSELNAKNASAGKKFVAQLLSQGGKQEASKFVNSQFAEVGKMLTKAAA